jgi:hypothetical protein
MSPAEEDPRTDDSLRSLIKMAREEFDEEPSAGLDALLMAAARKHAPAVEPAKPGVFERLRKWLGASMMNPAIAGATALVVIGGTAGVLYMRDPQKRMAEPTVVMRDQAQAKDVRGPATADEPEPALPVVVTEDEGAAEAPTEAKPEPKPRPERGRTKPPDPKPEVAVEGRLDNTTVSTGGAPGGGDTATFDLTGRGVVVGGVTTDMGHQRALEEKRPPPTADHFSLDASGEDDAEEVAVTESPPRTTTTAPSKRDKAANLLRQARTAAKKKNCSPVKVMAKEAQKLDATYYDAEFKKDPDVKNCL